MGKHQKNFSRIEGFDTEFTPGNLRERFGNKHILFFGETKKASKEIKGDLKTSKKFCIIYDYKNKG